MKLLVQQSIILLRLEIPDNATCAIGTLGAAADTVDEGRKACISIKTKRVYLEMYPQDIDDRIIMHGQCTELNERGGRIITESVDVIERVSGCDRVCGYDRKAMRSGYC